MIFFVLSFRCCFLRIHTPKIKRALIEFVGGGGAFLLALASLDSFAASGCSGFSDCERIFCELEYQIDQANHEGNQRKARGLNIALESAKLNCADSRLRRGLTDKIRESEASLVEYAYGLKEAQVSGRGDKVKTYLRRIEEEQDKLDELLNERAELDR